MSSCITTGIRLTPDAYEPKRYGLSSTVRAMEYTTTETLPRRDVEEVLGVARGNTVRARNVGRDITQSLRNLIGGELKAYSELYSDTRDQAVERMLEDAESMGADAVVNVRFETSQIAGSSAELLAYGTAVKIR